MKLKEDFCNPVFYGDKTFEVRENDRGFQTGDYIKFIPIDSSGLEFRHAVKDKIYEITYILSGWGIKEGYVVLGIKEHKLENDEDTEKEFKYVSGVGYTYE